ncbi:MAG: regulatory protein RecX [Coprothermobacterota bacterium]|nr:regulatory protein RecX [Coprothermobacterota bacterium]
MSETEESLKAIRAAIRYLRIRPRSRGEVEDYLRRKSFSPEVTQAALIKLEEEELLDDGKFLESWLHHRTEVMPRGSLIIKRELKVKKIPEKLIQEVAEPYIEEKEEEVAWKLAEKKWGTYSDPEERYRKTASFLKAKGFSSSVIYRVLMKLKGS